MRQVHRSKPFARKGMATAIATLAMTATTTPAVAELGFELEEVVVTATRRAESIQDIPYNISAVSGESIADAGAGSLADLMKIVPGVVFADQGARSNAQNSSIVLRGLNVAQQTDGGAIANLAVPTVSTYMDDTPLFLNLQLTDIERVEVLRGPQGTLYGSGSLAGTVRFIHNRPNTEEMSGSISGGVEFLGESDEETYSVDGMLNLPLSDNVALRVAGTFEDTGGVMDAQGIFQRDATGSPVLADPTDFINSPAATTGTQKDVDESQVYGIRTSLLWDVSDDVEALFVYHHQSLEAEGDSLRDAFQKDYVYSTSSLNDFEQDVDIYSVEVEADLGFATLTSSTSYSEVEVEQQRDLSPIIGILDGACVYYGCYPRGLFIGDEPGEREDFTQEFRLVSNGDGAIDWMVGAYYNEQKASLVLDQTVYGYAAWANTPGSAMGIGGGVGDTFVDFWLAPVLGAANPADEDNQFFNDRNTRFEDTAFFGEVTWHVTEEWQMTFGARYFEQTYESELLQVFSNCGSFCSADGVDVRGVASSSQSEDIEDQIFKFNTSYQLNEDANVYFTWAEGFRHGGANALPVGAFGITADTVPYEADETENWEIGLKGSFWDGRVDYTLAAFLIDWDKPQIDSFVSLALLPAVVNGESAESKGLELELKGQLMENLIASFGYNYTDAQLTDDFTVGTVTGIDGSSMPGIAEHQANLSLDYTRPLDNGLELRWHVDAQYKDEAENALKGDSSERTLDAFSLWNTSVSLQAEAWTVTAFVNNLFDEDEAVYAYSSFSNVDAAARPRSMGLRAAYRF